MEYYSIYKEHFRSILRMDDAQVGKVIKSLCEYVMTGEEPQELDLPCMILMDSMIDKINRDAEAYSAKTERMRSAAQKRWGKTDMHKHADAMQQHAQACTSMHMHTDAMQQHAYMNANACNQTNPNQTATVTNPNRTSAEGVKNSSTAAAVPLPFQGRPQDQDAIAQLERINDDRNHTFEAARNAGFSMSGANVEIINNLCVEYGDDTVRKAIGECVKYGKIFPAYLNRILSNWREGKKKPQTRAAPAPAKTVPAQQYEQREYEASTELPDWMKEELERMGQL